MNGMSWICGYGRDKPTDEVPMTFGEWTTCLNAIMLSDRLSDLTTEMALVFEITNYESYLIAGPFDGHYFATFHQRVEAIRSTERMNFDFVPIDAPEIRSFQEWTERTGRRSMESEYVERDRYERHARAVEEYAGILERSPRDLAFFRDIREETAQMDRRELCAQRWENPPVNHEGSDISMPDAEQYPNSQDLP
jgi:hypothetical protein